MSLVLDPSRADAPSVDHASRGGTPRGNDAQHFELLERAVTAALSPLDFPTAHAWADAVTTALCAVVGAQAGAVLLPGVPVRWHAVTGEHLDSPLALHEEATERLLASGTGDLVYWVRDDLAQGPSGVACGTVGIRVRLTDGGVAAVCVHRDRSMGAASAHSLAALRAIAPAFRAGVSAWVSAIASRSNVTRMLDSLADPALMFDAGGTLMHANPAVDRLTASGNVSRLRGEAQRIAWALGAVARRRTTSRAVGRGCADTAPDSQTTRRIQLAGMVYQLRGSIVGEALFGTEPAVLVTMTASSPEPLTDDVLHAEYSLTAREIQVARLMAEGLSNNEIAERLGVRFFTARNHVERTLAKLGVPSRNRVGPLLRNEVAESVAA